MTKRELEAQIREWEKTYEVDFKQLEDAQILTLESYLKNLTYLQGKLNLEIGPGDQQLWLKCNRKHLEFIIKDMAEYIEVMKISRGDFTKGHRPDMGPEELWLLAETVCHDKNQIN